MADPVNPALGRVSSNVCIYWESSQDNTQIPDPGRCTAATYFSSSLITCYNDKACNGAGTCRECSAFNPAGLMFSHKDVTTRYGERYVWVWNDSLKKYVELRKVTPEEAADFTDLSSSLPYNQKVGEKNFAGLQVPPNLTIYNLRAKFKKCCNWDAPPVEFSKDTNDTLYATVYGAGSKSIVPYLSTDAGGNYVYASLLNKCSLGNTTSSWTTPFTTENQCAYGCNGAKPECPYYTGPRWSYCIDSKMEHGGKISAAQIMELRYYSANWMSMANPYEEWTKRFKDPVIWAWSGTFADIDPTETPTSDHLPTVKRVYIDTFDTIEPNINIDPVERVDVGLPVAGESINYPTLIKELSSIGGGVSIVWPVSSASSPHIHRTFRIGQNQIFIFVDTPYPSEVYAINLSKHQQGATADSEFIETMLTSHEEDVGVGQTVGFGGLVVSQVELEYYPKTNNIKIFTRDPTSSTGEYLTDEITVVHQFTHAVVMQTKGEDRAGMRDIRPWIDRFENIYIEADVRILQGPLSLDTVLWDSASGNKITTYPVYYIIENQLQPVWVTLGCNGVAVYFSDSRCNPVYPWDIAGTYDGKTMGLYVDRSGNDSATETTVNLQVFYKSNDGAGIAADVVLAKPVDGTVLSTALDPAKDNIYATYRVTEYRQCPVISADRVKLKYPDYEQHYASEFPIEITIADSNDSFSVEGSFLRVAKVTGEQGQNVESGRIYNLNSVQEEIATRLKSYEDKAVYGFPVGGVQDDDIQTSTAIFQTAKDNFESQYDGYIFSDGMSVNLENTCNKLENIKLHEGEYKFLVIFKDERGKPIGAKRVYFMLQSAHAECRDVEIYYKWQMNLRPWYIENAISLLAIHSVPMRRGDLEGVETYIPKCGDHSEIWSQSHTIGDPGPMWYPYNKCRIPTYHEDHQYALVKCSSYVEGFDSNSSKRWAYWERMRGPDRMYTHIAGAIRIQGCFFREISYSYVTEGAQNFSGYTRIRSAHPGGPFAKDREAVHINRHFLKRNLKVRQEYVQRLEDQDDISVKWTDEFYQIAFTPGGAENVGYQNESPVWIHLGDGMSVVNRTTSDVQHPFSHYLLKSVGGYNYNETFSTDRLSIKNVLSEKDLTSTAQRNTNGTLVYKPGEILSSDPKENYSDIYPVFADKNISWAWLERPKDPVRGALPISGIKLYPPSDFTPPGQNISIPAIKQNRELAAYIPEGSYKLVYTPPEFDESSGAVTSNPTLSLAGGPPRVLNWISGDWIDTGTKYDISYYTGKDEYKDKFYMFGKGSTGTSLLMDSGGVQAFIGAVTNEGAQYYYTVRCLGVNTKVVPQELPYREEDYVYADSSATLKVSKAKESLLAGKNTTLSLDLVGYYYVNEIKMKFKYGPGEDDAGLTVRFDIPVIDIFSHGITGAVLTSSTPYEYTSSQEVLEVSGEDEAVYSYKDITYKEKRYTVGQFANKIQIDFSSLRGDARVDLDQVEILYRKPVYREEDVYIYERKVNVSNADSGTPDYRNLLYYYSRTIPDFGYSLTNQFSSSSSYPSIKWVNKNVKDVILEYEYTDPTNVRFAYKDEVKPISQPGVYTDSDDIISYTGDINLCTKSRTLFAREHMEDSPQNIEVGGDSAINYYQAAPNETASTECVENAGHLNLDEQAQECLYTDAKNLASNLRAEYTWFWHPDEIDFWENTVRIHVSNITCTLVLTSVVAPMFRLWEDEHFGCTSNLSTPYSDGRLHPIDPWQAAGHRVYTGNPAFNETCVQVVIFKIGEHVGEENWGKASYTELKTGATWPHMTYKDAAFYIDKGAIEKRGTYMGGTIGGAGLNFWVQQSQYAHGETAPQIVDWREMFETASRTQIQATSAEAGYSNFHYDQ